MEKTKINKNLEDLTKEIMANSLKTMNLERENYIIPNFGFQRKSKPLSDRYKTIIDENGNETVDYSNGLKTPNEDLFPQKEINKGNIGYNLWDHNVNKIFQGINPETGKEVYLEPQGWSDCIVPLKRGNISYENSIHKIIEDNITNGLGFSSGNKYGQRVYETMKDESSDVQHKLKLYNISTGDFDYKQGVSDLIDKVMHEDEFDNKTKNQILKPLFKGISSHYSND